MPSRSAAGPVDLDGLICVGADTASVHLLHDTLDSKVHDPSSVYALPSNNLQLRQETLVSRIFEAQVEI